MKRPESLERDLTLWFADAATPRVPDYTDDIIRLTAATGQRPRWSFPERWLPMSVITLARQTFKPLPWRTLGLLAVLALLLAGIVAVAGSRPTLPAPFGLARTGLVAYASGSDIHTVDPITGARRDIATGPEVDAEPRWSLDGTRLAFVRTTLAGGDQVVIVDPHRPTAIVSTEAFVGLDTDSVAWSPDGRFISIVAERDGAPAILMIDTATGDASPLRASRPLPTHSPAFWRPSDGRQVMVVAGVEPDVRLYLVSVTDGTMEEVLTVTGPQSIRVSGWTPDGQRFVYQRGEYDSPPIETHVLDVATGTEVILPAGYGHVSNDGTRMVALDDQESMCVVDLTGGPCAPVGLPFQAYGPTHAAGVQWSPDDVWILSRPPDTQAAFLVDPGGAALEQPSWLAGGGESWQRLAFTER